MNFEWLSSYIWLALHLHLDLDDTDCCMCTWCTFCTIWLEARVSMNNTCSLACSNPVWGLYHSVKHTPVIWNLMATSLSRKSTIGWRLIWCWSSGPIRRWWRSEPIRRWWSKWLGIWLIVRNLWRWCSWLDSSCRIKGKEYTVHIYWVIRTFVLVNILRWHICWCHRSPVVICQSTK